MTVTELADRVGITMANLSILKNGKVRESSFQLWRRFAGLWTDSLEIFWNTGRRQVKGPVNREQAESLAVPLI